MDNSGSITLTSQDVANLTRPFPVEAHEFKSSFCYVAEEEVTARLDEVDPGWMFEIKSIGRGGINNQVCIVTARLTVRGISRESTGMQAVEYQNNKPDRESGEPEKGATTDALRRCARLFGVGRYILKMGGDVKDKTQLAAWLKKNYPQQPAQPKPAAPVTTTTQPAPKQASCLSADEACKKQFTALRDELRITSDAPYLERLSVKKYSDYTGTLDELFAAMRNLHAKFLLEGDHKPIGRDKPAEPVNGDVKASGSPFDHTAPQVNPDTGVVETPRNGSAFKRGLTTYEAQQEQARIDAANAELDSQAARALSADGIPLTAENPNYKKRPNGAANTMLMDMPIGGD